MSDLNGLPLEILIEILINAGGVTLVKCRRVSKKWRDIIDNTDYLWKKICQREFKYSTRIAKNKSGNNMSWFDLYKNMVMWSYGTNYLKKMGVFYIFSMIDKSHVLDINYGVLPVRDTRGILIYDIYSFKYIPVAIPERNTFKISNNDFATVILIKSGILVQKTVENAANTSEAYFKADNFILNNEELYFFNNREIFKCDLSLDMLIAKLILRCDYVIKELQYNDKQIYIFTDCGKIVTVTNNKMTVKLLNCPVDWIKQIKHIHAINDKNFICYSMNLFKIETDNYKHLYLDFPHISSLFFYGDFVLIGTSSGQILLYRLSSQKFALKPIFEEIVVLPDGKIPTQLDVVERKCGPVIIVSTSFETMLVEIDFFPQETQKKVSFSLPKINMYKRLMRLKDRIKQGLPQFTSVS